MMLGAKRINILDLPAEVLFHIFSIVKFDSPFDLDGLHYFENLTQNTSDIKSLRLVCRTFASTCNPLLLPVVSCSLLDPEATDINKLEKISQNGDFSSSVRVVHVRLGFYDPVIAASLGNLALYLSWAWEEFVTEQHGIPFGRVSKIVRGWTLENQTDYESLQILRPIYNEYKRRYLLQLELHRSGSALRRLAQAMARMPAATRLVLDDEQPCASSRLGPLMLASLGKAYGPNYDDLSCLAAPMSWLDCWQLKTKFDRSPFDECRPPIDILINLPVMIHRAGIRLTGFRVLNLQIPSYVPAWDMLDRAEEMADPVDLAKPAELIEACRSLKVLEITPEYWLGGCMRSGGKYMAAAHNRSCFSWPVRDPTRRLRPWTLFFDIVRCMLSETLRQIHLDSPILPFNPIIEGFWPPSLDLHFEFDFGQRMFADHPTPDLEVLHLSNTDIGVPFGLGALLRGAGRLREVRLSDVQVGPLASLDGHPSEDGWAWLIQVLREVFPRMYQNWSATGSSRSDVVPSANLVLLEHISWMEYTGSPTRLETLAKSLFEDKLDHGFTAVENYIRGAADINPLVEAYERYPVDDWDNYSTFAF
ncbi:hypothetical protein PgNI_05438 [Pyricularia grisea]|uniref:F-box domain-containing protein n=1 Tax=Pyricularia grisea TaxID=148305 RepID=A0A6P8B4X8_PYRGI|nr:hypothetical protein PgNI_05438 [Pyricularia grisea]TLD10357.1 hypothetical protein PgNI_05438 [Pyricularia grisea]